MKPQENPLSVTAIENWYSRFQQGSLKRTEAHLVGRILRRLWGYHLLTLGCDDDTDWGALSHIPHRFQAQTSYYPHATQVCADYQQLPFAADTFDVALLPHVLDFQPHPRRVLAETCRVLMPEGHIIVLGFNAMSLWGCLSWWRRHAEQERPWCGHFFSLAAVSRWLRAEGCEVAETKTFFFLPPRFQTPAYARLQYLETLGQLFWPHAGGCYMIVAQKKVSGITPLKPRWRSRRLLASPIVDMSGATHGR